MEKEYIKISSLERMRQEDVFPYGANSPTTVTVYKCPCGQGRIVDTNVVGFNDSCITLECKNCEKKYRTYVDLIGYDFCFYLND